MARSIRRRLQILHERAETLSRVGLNDCVRICVRVLQCQPPHAESRSAGFLHRSNALPRAFSGVNQRGSA